MKTKFHISARGLQGEIAAYAKRFNLLELRVPKASELKSAASAATLRRYRRAVPPAFQFAVLAGPAVSAAKAGNDLEKELEYTLLAATALEARAIVVRTPREVTPAPIWRERLSAVVERLPADVTHRVWEPGGIWEQESAIAFGKKHGLVVCVDPTQEAVPPGAVAYCRIRGLGNARALNVPSVTRVLESIGERSDAYIVLETEHALVECKRIRQVASTIGSKQKIGGMSRVLRPRVALKAADDEQE